MRVLCLIDTLVASGAEKALLVTAPAMMQRGVQVDVAYLREAPGMHQEFLRAGIDLFPLGGPGGPVGAVWRAERLVARLRPDLVHTTLLKANVVGRLAGGLASTPVVSSLVNVVHGLEQMSAPGVSPWRARVRRGVDVATARRVRRFHAITRWVADVMAPRLRVDRGRIDVVPRGRDPEGLGTRTPERRLAARRALAVPDGAPVLLAVARQDHQKGLDVLLDAVPGVLQSRPDARVLLVGRPGNATAELECRRRRLGLEPVVTFEGTRDDVGDLMCAADAFLLPSRWEGLASVLVEAMALQLPIVASALPPVREVVVPGEHALLVPPGDEQALADAVLQVLDRPEEAAVRAAAARQRFLRCFTVDRVADGMRDFYERALGPVSSS